MSEHIYESAIREQIARISPDNKKQLQQFSSHLFDTISQGLLQDGHVRIHQFGSFKLIWAKERRGRHPKTGEPLIIPAQPRVSFTPAKALKDQVNAQPVIEHPVTAPTKSPANRKKPAQFDEMPAPTSAAENIMEENTDSKLAPATNKASSKSQPFNLNHKTALAASIIITLIAALLLNQGSSDLNTQITDRKLHIDNHTELTITPQPVTIQSSSHRIITSEPSARTQPDEAEKLIAQEKPQTPETLRMADLPHDEITVSAPFFRKNTHRLIEGDSLWRLSRKHYINPFYWPHIFQANQNSIDNPNKLKTGSTIQLPSLHGSPDNLTSEDRRNIAEGYILVYHYHKKNNKAYPYYALLGAQKFDPAVVQKHIYDIDEQDWHSLQLVSN